MSYCTRVEIEWDDSEEKRSVDVERIVERARIFVAEQNISDDVLGDLRTALEGPLNQGVGFNRMYCDYIVGMLQFLSLGFLGTRFFVRGAGEEFLDLWIREFKNGEITLSHGPWNE